MAGSLKTPRGESYQLSVEDGADSSNPTLEVLMYGGRGVGKSVIATLWMDLDRIDHSRQEFEIRDTEYGTIHLKLFSEDQKFEFKAQVPQADAVVFVYDTTPASLECVDLVWKSVRHEMHVNQFIQVLKNRDDSSVQTREDRNLMFSMPVNSSFFRLPTYLEGDGRTLEALEAAVTAARRQLFAKTYRCHVQNRQTPQTPRFQSPGLQSMSVVYGIGLRRTNEDSENIRVEIEQENLHVDQERKKSKRCCCL